MNTKRILTRAAIFTVLSLLASVSYVQALTISWVSGAEPDKDWLTAANWNAGVPGTSTADVALLVGAADDAVVSSPVAPVNQVTFRMRSGSTVDINADFSNINRIELGASGSATGSQISQTAGNVSVNNYMQVGSDGSSAAYTLSGGSLDFGSSVNLYATGTLNQELGTSLTVGSSFAAASGGTFNFGTGGDGVGVSLLVGGAMSFDDGAVFTVGAGSTLTLGNATHAFADGLDVDAGGTIGTGNNSTATATIGTGVLTLNSGTTIDYSINGNDASSDQWLTNGGLSLDPLGSYSLVVDVVAGDVKQTAGPWTIFDNVGATPITNFNPANWTITTAEGTRLSSTGTLLIDPDDSSKLILSGFEAFSIPEPSTAMLLGMGAMVMLLRRRIRK